ncbi:MAG: hypothetical protein KDD63_12960, partial [Bacteroidetes bacterium]|nr:hypothetical protein [Bacteroidota bacterium]
MRHLSFLLIFFLAVFYYLSNAQNLKSELIIHFPFNNDLEEANGVSSISQGYSSFVNGRWEENNSALKMENGFILSTNESSGALQSFSIAFWLKTNSNAGGKIIGFESTQFALSQSYDRHIQMGPEGRINFCIWPHKTVVLTSPKPYNDNQWHFVVATNGERGAKLYVDNILVNSTGFQNLAPY